MFTSITRRCRCKWRTYLYARHIVTLFVVLLLLELLPPSRYIIHTSVNHVHLLGRSIVNGIQANMRCRDVLHTASTLDINNYNIGIEQLQALAIKSDPSIHVLPGAPATVNPPIATNLGKNCRFTVDEIIQGSKIQALASITLLPTSSATSGMVQYMKTYQERIVYMLLPAAAGTSSFSLNFWNQPGADNFDGISEQQIETLRLFPSIFVFGHNLPSFIETVAPRLRNKYVLITGNSDENIDERYLRFLDNSPLLTAWFAQNVVINHEKLFIIPIGIANPKWAHGRPDLVAAATCTSSIGAAPVAAPPDDISRDKLCYAYFSKDTNEAARGPVVAKAREVCGWTPHMSYPEYITTLGTYKFAFCPNGNGVDTHRLWEALYQGTICIIVNNPPTAKDQRQTIFNKRLVKELNVPVVIVDDWSKVSRDLLNNIDYQTLQQEAFNAQSLRFSYWETRIKSISHSIVSDSKVMKPAVPTSSGSLVLIHLSGSNNNAPTAIPQYLFDCIEQINYISRDTMIYLLTDTTFTSSDGESSDTKEHFINKLQLLHPNRIEVVQIQDIPISIESIKFDACSRLDRNFRGGFKLLTSKRFVTLFDFAQWVGLTDFFHMEYDNLLYIDTKKILEGINKSPEFSKSAGVFDSNKEGTPSLTFFRNADALKDFVNYMVEHGSNTDMENMSQFRKHVKGGMGPLPVITKEYADKLWLTWIGWYDFLYKHEETFGFLFDARAVGQYIGGLDERNLLDPDQLSKNITNIISTSTTEGFVNTDSLFRADLVDIQWSRDLETQDMVPLVAGKRIANLHIHSKDLRRWMTKAMNILPDTGKK